MNARRRAALERDLGIAEAAYERRLAAALRSCASGKWGMFGINDAVIEREGLGARYSSEEARELLHLGDKITDLRIRLGYTDAYDLHERYLVYRRNAKDANSPGEPKLAHRFLEDIAK